MPSHVLLSLAISCGPLSLPRVCASAGPGLGGLRWPYSWVPKLSKPPHTTEFTGTALTGMKLHLCPCRLSCLPCLEGVLVFSVTLTPPHHHIPATSKPLSLPWEDTGNPAFSFYLDQFNSVLPTDGLLPFRSHSRQRGPEGGGPTPSAARAPHRTWPFHSPHPLTPRPTLHTLLPSAALCGHWPPQSFPPQAPVILRASRIPLQDILFLQIPTWLPFPYFLVVTALPSKETFPSGLSRMRPRPGLPPHPHWCLPLHVCTLAESRLEHHVSPTRKLIKDSNFPAGPCLFPVETPCSTRICPTLSKWFVPSSKGRD